jgi:hypothetical protein
MWDKTMPRDFPQLADLSVDTVGKVNEALRCGLVQGWKSRIRLECLKYLREAHGVDWYLRRKDYEEVCKDLAAMADVMSRVYQCDWWEWNQGSALFFWRWHPEFKTCAWDGIPVFMLDQQPLYKVPQPPTRSEDVQEKVKEKLSKVRERGYIEKGFVKSLTGYFPVKKSLFNIRMVYDASKCGLNKLVWAPNFFIPSVDSMVDVLDHNSWMADIDLGKTFPLGPSSETSRWC